jgi:hypothetical protein
MPWYAEPPMLHLPHLIGKDISPSILQLRHEIFLATREIPIIAAASAGGHALAAAPFARRGRFSSPCLARAGMSRG